VLIGGERVGVEGGVVHGAFLWWQSHGAFLGGGQIRGGNHGRSSSRAVLVYHYNVRNGHRGFVSQHERGTKLDY